MADFTHIYTLVNDIVSEMTGVSGAKAVDSASFVSLGKTILGDDSYKESFLGAFVNRIGRVVFMTKSYSANVKGIEVDPMRWGYYYGRYKKDIDQAVRNEDFVKSNNPTERPMNPTEYKPSTNIIDKWYSGFGVWEFNDVIYGDQLDTAFTSEVEFDGYVTMVYQSMYNSYELSKEGTANEARNTYMINAKSYQVVNLVDKYNTEVCKFPELEDDNLDPSSIYGESGVSEISTTIEGDAITYSRHTPVNKFTALNDKNFLKWAYTVIKTSMTLMKKPSKQFNDGTVTEWIKDGDMRVDMLTDFAEAFNSQVTAVDFHSEVEGLPDYNEVAYWQTMSPYPLSGDSNHFRHRATVKGYVGTGEEKTEKTINNVVAFIHDASAVAMTSDKPRVVSQYEKLNDRTIISAKGRLSYLCDLSSNGLIFTLN